jgi:hypothetical protein
MSLRGIYAARLEQHNAGNILACCLRQLQGLVGGGDTARHTLNHIQAAQAERQHGADILLSSAAAVLANKQRGTAA